MKCTILSLLFVGLFAGVGTSAIAQNVTAGDQPNADAKTTEQPAEPAAGAATAPQPAEPAAGDASASQRDEEYQAALKKCEALTGAEKTTCVDVAKKKSGQM